MKFQEMCDIYENRAEELRKENAELKAKLQVSDLQRVKNFCLFHSNNHTCNKCSFHCRDSILKCCLVITPNNWDIDFILEKLDD